jgi:hypothetical protein
LDFWSSLDNPLFLNGRVSISGLAKEIKKAKKLFADFIFSSTALKFFVVNNLFWHAFALSGVFGNWLTMDFDRVINCRLLEIFKTGRNPVNPISLLGQFCFCPQSPCGTSQSLILS